MKPLFIALVAACGFAAGWMLPALPVCRHGGTPDSARAAVRHGREAGKIALLDGLLDFGDRERHKIAAAASLPELLSVLRQQSSFGDMEAGRIVDMDPAAALDQWLADPSVGGQMCEMIAVEWGRRNPGQAIGYLRKLHSYRAQDCLDKVLLGVRWQQPLLVGEVIRTKSREWQEQHLEEWFSGTSIVRKPGAPPEPVSDDPFETIDDGWWVTKNNGEGFLNDLADDELRRKAVEYWKEKPPEPPPPARSKPVLDIANFDANDYSQVEALRVRIKEFPEPTLAAVAALGGLEIRRAAIRHVVAGFSMDKESWPAEFINLEREIRQIGVVPDAPPSHFEIGVFLWGETAAHWISRQPLALQRAWSPAFTEKWARFEPGSALNWARSLAADANRDLAVQSGLIVWAHENPTEAAAYVAALPPGDLRESSISNASAAWSRVDRTGAVRWLDTLPESPGKTRALERVK